MQYIAFVVLLRREFKRKTKNFALNPLSKVLKGAHSTTKHAPGNGERVLLFSVFPRKKYWE